MFNANYEVFKGMIAGKKVAVLGLGISNLPAIEFLHKHGAVITGCDRNMREKFDEKTFDFLQTHCNSLRLGDDYLETLTDFDILVKSPGIRPHLPQIQAARDAGVLITSEMEIFMSLCPCRIIGVTGSDGKTTTTTLIYEMLKQDGKNVHVGGNIGSPLINKLDYINEDDFVVLELSSFQLQIIGISPDIAVITNISPNHLDYHKSMEEYTEAKANIFKYQNEHGKLVINADNVITAGFAGRQKGELVYFTRKGVRHGAYVNGGRIFYDSEDIMSVSDIRLRGVHNLENYLAAVAALHGIVDRESMVAVARNFAGVAHRMEYVRTVSGVEFYNDSIGSSPTRTMAGLAAHDGKIVLIAGGYDKKLSFDELGKAIKDRVSALVLCGATADLIAKSVLKAYPNGEKPLNMLKMSDFEGAIKGAFALAKALDNGDGERISVILSPACASFDMFKNFEVRGNKFKEIVNSLTE